MKHLGDGGRVLAAVAEAESAETAKVQASVGPTAGNDATETKGTPVASASPVAASAADAVAEKPQEAAIRAAAAAKATSRLSVGAQVRKD